MYPQYIASLVEQEAVREMFLFTSWNRLSAFPTSAGYMCGSVKLVRDYDAKVFLGGGILYGFVWNWCFAGTAKLEMLHLSPLTDILLFAHQSDGCQGRTAAAMDM